MFIILTISDLSPCLVHLHHLGGHHLAAAEALRFAGDCSLHMNLSVASPVAEVVEYPHLDPAVQETDSGYAVDDYSPDRSPDAASVSYTHLTLPTKRIV